MSIASQAPSESAPDRAKRGRPGYDRAQVLDVAVQLFIEKGYDATSVADLAERLGLTKSALYHHFESKEQLLALALDEALTGLEQVLEQPAAQTGSAASRLGHVIRGAVVVLIEKLPYVTLLLRVRGNSPVEVAALERRRVFDHRVTEVVSTAQAERLLRDDVDAAVATRLIFGMVNSLTEWYRPGGQVDAEAMAAIVLATAMDGMAAAERS
ncbi:TetR/AcrR family transcriptional regulator [Agromyces aerolatus]|uniref:TetR/AcrR family transcriptional regulator n=1 Tax=Agromyces sp. LY-1074 TaxID=3074080 RepID=UPI0028616613|nr:MULTISPECIES: TetR/AcrR family transcriptional regulator [unclassified Agromyces]MDR5699440.1 TetR/AcrR family transcriptional regulator [Agromyces sp. LY-1074]MDR5705736.1 TetR/AcrR family transcriptional regulator [Agromyces sp. LY-1358]